MTINQSCPKNDNAHRVNIFLANSLTQYLISEYIVRYLEGDAQNYLFLYKSPTRKMPTVRHKYWTFIGEITSPKHPPPGCRKRHWYWKRYKCMVSNMKYVAHKLPQDSRSICLHMNSFRTPNNFFINYLRHCFSDSKFRVRLLMDGSVNIARRPLRIKHRLKQPIYKLIRLVFPELNYYCFKGDATGIDASIVDRLYLFRGFPHEYSSEKVHYLPLNRKRKEIRKNKGQILVLGHPEFKNLCHKMLNWARIASDGKEIIYKPHPSECNPPLPLEHCRLAPFSEALEVHLMDNDYPMIIGAASTGLITARCLCGEQARIISYGNDYLYSAANAREKRLLKKLDKVFKKMNIERIEAE